MNERGPSEVVRLLGADIKKGGGFGVIRVNSPEQWGVWKKRQSRVEQAGWRKVSGVMCDKSINKIERKGETSQVVWFTNHGTEEKTGGRGRGSRG